MGMGSLGLSTFAAPLQALSRWLYPRAIGAERLGHAMGVGRPALGATPPPYLQLHPHPLPPSVGGEPLGPGQFIPGLALGTPTPASQRPEHDKAHDQVHVPSNSGHGAHGARLVSEAKQARPLAHGTHAVRRPPARHVLRVVHSSCNNGFDKLFISGRMADVCAELDRLAAKEAMA